jgi:hypothetical protein
MNLHYYEIRTRITTYYLDTKHLINQNIYQTCQRMWRLVENNRLREIKSTTLL